MSISGTIAAAITLYFTGGNFYAAAAAYSIAAGVESLVLAKGTSTRGPTLSDLTNQISTYGAVIPIVRGAMRIPGNIIFATDKIPSDNTVQNSGKGGGGTSATTTSYFSTFAIAFCEGPCFGFGRMWIDKKLSINFQNTADAATLLASANIAASIRFYAGTEDQLPDPFLEAQEGVGNASAFRGTCYIVFERFDLTPYGNRIPVIEVEVIADGTKGVSHKELFRLGTNDAGLNTDAPEFWSNVQQSYAVRRLDTGSNGHLVVFKATDGNPALEYARPNFTNSNTLYAFASTTQTPWLHGLTLSSSTLGPGNVQSLVLCALDASDSFALNDAQDPDNPFNQLFFALPTEASDDFHFAGSADSLCAIDEYTGHFSFAIRSTNGNYYAERVTIFNGSVTPAFYMVRPAGTGAGNLILALAQLNGRVYALVFIAADQHMHLLQISVTDGTLISDWDGPAFAPSAATRIRETMRTDGSLVWVWAPAESSVFRWNEDGSFTILSTGVNATDEVGKTANGVGRAGAFINDAVLLTGPDGSTTPPPGDAAHTYWEFQAVHFNAILSVGVPLADVVQGLCVPHGVTPVTDELTDFVSGVVLTKQMSPADALTFLAAIYHFDGQPDGAMLRFKKRGSAPVMTIAVSDLAAHDFGANDADDAFPLDRAKELDIAQYVSVNFTDINNDYQQGNVPAQRLNTESTQQLTLDATAVALSATQAIQLAAVARDLAVVERMKSSKWSGDYRLKALQAADVVLIDTGYLTLRHRIRKVTDQAGLLQFESVADDAYVYDQVLTAENKMSSGSVLVPPGTRLDLLDIPILQDADDDTGVYARLTPTTAAGWAGASLSKIDQGDAKVLGAVTQRNSVGIATTQLPAFSGFGFDESSTVDVELKTPGSVLNSTTSDKVLAGVNAALWGDEVGGYRTAMLLSAAAQRYRLSGLLRNQRGTENTAHVAGERFVPLSLAGTLRFDLGASEIGVTHRFGGVTTGRNPASADKKSLTNTAVGKRPFAPVHLGAGVLGNNDVLLRWTRQTRLAAVLRDSVDAPLGEASELYVLEIATTAAFTTVKRTFTGLTSPTCTYANADRYADEQAGLPLPFYWRVRQVSAVYGPGKSSAILAMSAPAATAAPVVVPPGPNQGWNAADYGPATTPAFVLSNQGITAQKTGSRGTIRSLKSFAVGRIYFELRCDHETAPTGIAMGLCSQSTALVTDEIGSPSGLGLYYRPNGQIFTINGSTIGAPGPYTMWGDGAIIGVAIDLNAGQAWMLLNNVPLQGNPSTMTSPLWTFPSGTTMYAVLNCDPANQVTLLAAAATQNYAAPTSFTPLGT